MAAKIYDIFIAGAGVTGTADALIASWFTNIRKIFMAEKYSWVGQVNSNPRNNAQTSHDGSTETNYSLAHALEVLWKAIALRRYLDSKGVNPLLYRKIVRMVLGIGEQEVQKLEERFSLFKPHYQDLEMAYATDLARMEPKVMEGRDPNQMVASIYSREGYVVNYQMLAEEMMRDAIRMNPEFEYAFNCPVQEIEFIGDHYKIRLPYSTIYAKTVIFAAGAYSLYFAQKLGYGLQYALFPVGGSFLSLGHIVNSKIYRMQIEGMPFAEPHIDPDILNMMDSRGGPTTKFLPMMERYHYNTIPDFLELPLASAKGLYMILSILHKRKLLGYALENIVYDLPIIGPAAFLNKIRPIIPTIRYNDVRLRRGAGGIRPQIVNMDTGELEMGSSKIIGVNSIYNTTPSPGASICIGEGKIDLIKIVDFLGHGYYFDEEKFQKELGKIK